MLVAIVMQYGSDSQWKGYSADLALISYVGIYKEINIINIFMERGFAFLSRGKSMHGYDALEKSFMWCIGKSVALVQK